MGTHWPWSDLWVDTCDWETPVTNIQYYTLRFYFPYLSLLAHPVNITLYGPGLDCLVFDSVPERYLHYYFR